MLAHLKTVVQKYPEPVEVALEDSPEEIRREVRQAFRLAGWALLAG